MIKNNNTKINTTTNIICKYIEFIVLNEFMDTKYKIMKMHITNTMAKNILK